MTLRITPTQTAKFILNNSTQPDGSIRADLNNLPQTPQTLFALWLLRRPERLIKTPATCGLHFGYGIFTPWSGTTPKGDFAAITRAKTTTGAPCPAAAAAKVAVPSLSGAPDAPVLRAPSAN